jgi:hypothetical protein
MCTSTPLIYTHHHQKWDIAPSILSLPSWAEVTTCYYHTQSLSFLFRSTPQRNTFPFLEVLSDTVSGRGGEGEGRGREGGRGEGWDLFVTPLLKMATYCPVILTRGRLFASGGQSRFPFFRPFYCINMEGGQETLPSSKYKCPSIDKHSQSGRKTRHLNKKNRAVSPRS